MRDILKERCGECAKFKFLLGEKADNRRGEKWELTIVS
jgi:hypothetical protein